MASAHALALSPTAPKLQPRSGEEFGQVCRASEDLGVSKGGRPAPHFGPGIRKGVKLPCACLCLLSAGAESRGPARPERVEGKSKNLRKHKRDNKRLPERKTVPAACEVPRRGKRVEGKNKNLRKHKRDNKRLPTKKGESQKGATPLFIPPSTLPASAAGHKSPSPPQGPHIDNATVHT